ncbi:MAG TPA: BON domain-containing protein [Thermoanaerobaculia bacterium]|nr:BON domain-containing protein [Thermoanaerobaculia bacterium]
MLDKQLQKDVLNEVDWEPSVHAEDIGIAVKDGVVTLSGSVGTYAEKLAAERAAKRVRGVKAVAVDIEVKVPSMLRRSDTDIAKAAVDALAWDVEVPHEKLKVKVENGWITLDGEVDWAYQKDAAARAVRNLAGVRGLTNMVTLKPHVETAEIKRRLNDAFKRNAELEAKSIRVDTTDGKVALWGKVHSWQQHDEATQIVWSAPGVIEVEDHLTIAS